MSLRTFVSVLILDWWKENRDVFNWLRGLGPCSPKELCARIETFSLCVYVKMSDKSALMCLLST